MTFQQKTPLLIESKRFIIKTLDNISDVERVLNLRYKVFYEELMNRKLDQQLDCDEFDEICDHLVIIEKETDKILGTYRLICSTFSEKFYSESEFDLTNIKNKDGIKLELGRACIDSEHRSGVMLMLLWKGLYEYSKTVNASYVFGCSSFRITEPFEIARICNYLEKENILSDLGISVQEKYIIDSLDKYKIMAEAIHGEVEIPVLLKSYLKAGAKVHKEPAIDMDFECIDFLTLLEFKELNNDLKKKFTDDTESP